VVPLSLGGASVAPEAAEPPTAADLV
jgi:hypothetical protein